MNRFIKSVLVAGALLAAPALAQPVLEPSQTVPYSGVLDLDGAPYEGPVDLRFSIHDALEEGACVWDEVHTAVPVSTGRFGVALGTVALEEAAPAEGCPDPRPLHAALLEPDARYLSVEVRVPGEGAEWLTLSGRQMIGAAPFAMRGVQEGDFIVDGAVRAQAVNAPAIVAQRVAAEELDTDTLTATGLGSLGQLEVSGTLTAGGVGRVGHLAVTTPVNVENGGMVTIGDPNAVHMRVDQNDLQVYNAGAPNSTLYLQSRGGEVRVGQLAAATSLMRVYGQLNVGRQLSTPSLSVSTTATMNGRIAGNAIRTSRLYETRDLRGPNVTELVPMLPTTGSLCFLTTTLLGDVDGGVDGYGACEVYDNAGVWTLAALTRNDDIRVLCRARCLIWNQVP